MKPLTADEPMTLWSAAGGDAYGAMKGDLSPARERRDVGARALELRVLTSLRASLPWGLALRSQRT
jgi:hypothetical protein